MKNSLKVWAHLSLFSTLVVNGGALLAQTASFEVGSASLPMTTLPFTNAQSPFTTITFDTPFASAPNVFPMTPEFGSGTEDDPCTIRIRNVSATGFDAACLEPISEDRESPAVNFNYVATIDGVLNIPIAGSSATTRVESRCNFVSAQVFGPNCSNCTLRSDQSQSFATQGFTSAFSTAPVLLTQINSTNNALGGNGLPGGEPEFLEVAVQTNSVGSSSFNWAIDRMEAGNGNLNSGEELCYLAVEPNGCQELDFSSFGGPSSVDFTAVIGGNVDGHDNGATTGEGATFPASCFSSTPTIIGNSRSRNGNNGGILRLASQNSNEAIFTFDEDTVSDTERAHIDEQVSVLAFSSTFTTPVTLSQAQVSQNSRNTHFKWQTASETFHLGFHIWGESSEGWEQLNRKMIFGSGIDTTSTQSYKRSIRLSRAQYGEMKRFGISTVDNNGFEQFYGPFELNTNYGSELNNEPVDWTATRKQFEKNMQARGFIKLGQRWRQVSEQRKARIIKRQLAGARTRLNLEFDHSGMHAVQANELFEYAPQWQGRSLNRLALTLNGEPVARDIISDDNTLSADDTIVFNVKRVSGSDAVYLNNYTYQLSMNRAKVRSANLHDGQVDDASELSSTGLVSVTATQNAIYNASISADSPWVDASLISRGQPTNKNYVVDLPKLLDQNSTGFLDITLFGGINLPGDIDDHHAQISLNGEQLHDAVFDGLSIYQERIVVPAGLLKQSNNQITVTVVGDTGLFADLILVDDVILHAPHTLNSAQSYNFSQARVEPNEQVLGYKVEINSPSTALAYAYTSDGLLSRITPSINDEAAQLRFLGLANSEHLQTDLDYIVTQLDMLSKPASIELAHTELLHSNIENSSSNQNLLIVSHPNFIGDTLAEYADFKRARGFEVSIIDWLELVETYGYGNNTPDALNNFLSFAFPNAANDSTNGAIDTHSLLIVGGHTYDYLGKLNDNTVNFIPTHYSEVSIFNFTPSDNAFVDLDNDNIPELAIGRWPVRSASDLNTITAKSITWHENKDANPYQSALMLSQADDSSGLDFEKQLDMRVKLPLSNLDEFEQIEHISMKQLSARTDIDDPVESARQSIQSQINDGLDLLSFSGHASYGFWGFQGVVNTDFVKNLSNQGKPTIVMPLACYTSNYENPSINTLAHQWLFAGEQGAAAIHGASVLGEYRENAIFAERYLNQSASSKTIGEAILKAKKEMGSANQMLHNWAYLGDPTLPLR